MNVPTAPLCLLFLYLLLTGSQVHAQTRYLIDSSQGTELQLRGTSTLHDWQMVATTVTGAVEFAFTPDGTGDLSALESMAFSLKVQDLCSGNRGLDKNAHRALNAEAHSSITYVLASSTLSRVQDGYRLQTRGRLTIAGTARDIKMEVRLVVGDNGTITSRGTHELKMTDYGVTPPSFMLGAMKTGDDMTLEFTVVFKKSPGA
ncbi:YceI family protein [Neolewinella litorea]|uniref:YceI family protein n=1 Tax=Neolewinella litorea TaxID=2562452 RepID=A0A4S4NBU9_9BACT|nr:YceI family protein [Neolewinella litorea]THH35481.1 YceI family protein [Neolewinella litorea]